ncbi:RluA family pseudouridine synthase [Bacillus spongiae]|uniref:Pseudouridine synthase n=1 Tax=Bacillus spongiae TaxID=2683610 RepID=A0ABU8HAP9_9BACI
MNFKRQGNTFILQISGLFEKLTINELLQTKWNAPKKLIHQFRMEKAIKVNGLGQPWNNELKLGDLLSIELFKEEAYGFLPHNVNAQILFEDDHLLVVNKPAGVDTHPNSPDQTNTLANGVAFHLKEKGEQCRAYPIHRLDRHTTGAVIFAKHALSQAILDRMLRERKIKRTYWALAHGKMKEDKGTIQKNIGRDRHHPTRRRVSPKGQTAVTHYQKLCYYPKAKLTLVELSLDTGRTHQIRVHMSNLGHPLAGDTLYGGTQIFPNQALHARKISFQHPLTFEKIECTAPFLQEEVWDIVGDDFRT